ncbi:MAG: bifunctional phosphoribosyl-AMP cyclohydrolase/phosphoribosyl-ATP diphosphatase HisIE [Acidaminococcales bacterium]|jgi:phosphoribosyl-ATP pyrophosphohydrolase/phosphoribosyl-AMP cyclohydrolase|nr:bifunctional phosphoribosyl-AMP cyclohydrolase/phosphoribosyl-ATP diphosphatase HisIE [Acidaminococcales bacterium]
MNFTADMLKFDQDGLVPAIVQDISSQAVLTLAYMNKESLQKTVETGYTWFYSRSRKELWNKGATSGNVQKVCSISYDCDADALLLMVEQTGAACHKGSFSCFANLLWQSANKPELPAAAPESMPALLNDLYLTITERRRAGDEKSYTRYLFNAGQDKILKKVGEEAAETIIASKNHAAGEIIYEMADLWYHCLVLLAYHDIKPNQLLHELADRRK